MINRSHSSHTMFWFFLFFSTSFSLPSIARAPDDTASYCFNWPIRRPHSLVLKLAGVTHSFIEQELWLHTLWISYVYHIFYAVSIPTWQQQFCVTNFCRSHEVWLLLDFCLKFNFLFLVMADGDADWGNFISISKLLTNLIYCHLMHLSFLVYFRKRRFWTYDYKKAYFAYWQMGRRRWGWRC